MEKERKKRKSTFSNGEAQFKEPSPKKQKRTVLDEDAYMQVLGDIIARDFFPDAVDHQDSSSTINSIQNTPTLGGGFGSSINNTPRSSTPTSGSTPTPVQVSPKLRSNLSLNDFLATHISEDNASFDALVQKENEVKRAKYKNLYPQTIQEDNNSAKSSSQMALPPTDTILSKFMFAPSETVEESPSSKLARKSSTSPSKQIVYENTRISDSVLKKNVRPRTTTFSNYSSVENTPRVGGYSYVSTPNTSCGQTPVMSWGEIEGEVEKTIQEEEQESETRQRKSWNLPELVEREEIGKRLAEQAKKSLKEKKSNMTGIGRKEPSAEEVVKRNLQFSRNKGTPTLTMSTELREKYGNVMMTPPRVRSVSNTPRSTPL